jgi:hypothetical protein
MAQVGILKGQTLCIKEKLMGVVLKAVLTTAYQHAPNKVIILFKALSLFYKVVKRIKAFGVK